MGRAQVVFYVVDVVETRERGDGRSSCTFVGRASRQSRSGSELELPSIAIARGAGLGGDSGSSGGVVAASTVLGVAVLAVLSPALGVVR